MKHYEVLLIIHPDQTDQVKGMVDRYVSQIKESSGQVHRLEDWGKRQLAYPIQKLHKAHYVLMNIECDAQTLSELEEAIRYNDAIIRKLILSKKVAVSSESPILKGEDKRDERPARGTRPGSGPDARSDRPKKAETADVDSGDLNDDEDDS